MGVDELPGQDSNPYHPPSDRSLESIRGAIDDALSTRDRAEFSGEVTKRDLRHALNMKSFRADLVHLRKSRWFLLIPAVLVGLLHWTAYRQTGVWSEKTVILIACLLGYFAYVNLLRLWTVRQCVQLNADAIGPTRGWIDRDKLFVEDDHGQGFMFVDAMIGFAVSRRQLVLSADKTHSRFIVLPFRFFEDPDTAQLLAQSLAAARPFMKPETLDSRRKELPSVESEFQPSEHAIFYSGEVLCEDIKGTPLQKRISKVKWAAFGRTVLTLGLPMLMVLALGLPEEFIWVAGIFLTLVLLRVTYRIVRAPLIGQADDDVMFRTAGWVEDGGLVIISKTGQASLKWSAFQKEAAITNRLMAIQTKSQSVWHMLGRDQFESEDDWDSACEIVRKQTGLA